MRLSPERTGARAGASRIPVASPLRTTPVALVAPDSVDKSAASITQVTPNAMRVAGVPDSDTAVALSNSNLSECAASSRVAQQREQSIAAFQHGGAVNSIAFSPNSHWLVTGSLDNTTKFIDVGTYDVVDDRLYGSPVQSVAVSHDSTLVAIDLLSGGVVITPIGIQTDEPFFGPSPDGGRIVTSMAFSPVSALLVMGTIDGHRIVARNGDARRQLRRFLPRRHDACCWVRKQPSRAHRRCVATGNVIGEVSDGINFASQMQPVPQQNQPKKRQRGTALVAMFGSARCALAPRRGCTKTARCRPRRRSCTAA